VKRADLVRHLEAHGCALLREGGKPCIRELRITVDDVLSYLAAGMSEDEILADFPDLEREDFRAVYAFAADRERRLLTDPIA
jgi:uncharacterized protein (DUF433 family)